MSRRLKEAGAPLHPRIDSEIANHLGYVDGALKGREFFVGKSLTGADIQMSFVGEMAKVFDKLGPYPNLARLADADARAAGVPALGREGRGVPVCEVTPRRPSGDGARAPDAERRRNGALWQTPIFRPPAARGYGPRLNGHDGRAGDRPWQSRHPHHILHKYQARTASAWPPRADMVSRQRRFRPPHMTDRYAPKGLRRWRYFAHELFVSSAKTASAPDSFFTATLDQADPEIAAAIKGELGRQRHEIELIASENIVSRAVLEAQGSVMTNKYAEGYPGKRYYGGCEWVDVAETLAIERAKKLFGASFANVQPNSGSQMNQAVFLALLQPGDTFMGLDLAAGGHLTHGSPVNMSGKWFKARTTPCAARTRSSTWTRSRAAPRR